MQLSPTGQYEGLGTGHKRNVFALGLHQLVNRHLRSVSITLDLRSIDDDPLNVAWYATDEDINSSQTTNQKVLNAHAYFAQFINRWREMLRFAIRRDFV